MQMRRIVVAIAVLGALSGCRRAPDLRPRLIFAGEPVGNDFWLEAPYVAAVKILRADLMGSREPVFQGGPRTLQLVKFVATVDNMIKGDMPNRKIAFYFFDKVDQDQDYYLRPGRRYIVSLRSEGGVLRSWADASQLHIWVHSGSHNQKDLPLDLGPEATIAYILLTPGADCDLKEFGNTLDSHGYGEPGYAYGRLKLLQLHPDRALRDSACVSIASMFAIRPKCLKQCLDSPDSGNRQAAAEFLRDPDSAKTLEWLPSNPFSQFQKPWTDYMSQMFEIYTEDMRPEVRKAACAAWRSLAPQQAAKRCR